MKLRKTLFNFAILAATIGTGLVACTSTSSTSQQATDRKTVAEATNTIGAAQPLPPLTYSTQRQVMIESLINMAVPGKPMYMIATNDGAGDDGQIPIIAYAVVKGCVPATFQLTRPSEVARSSSTYGYAILEQAEINSMYTGNTAATYCIGMDGTFFAIEHKTSFSSKPFSEVIRSRAAVDFNPDLTTSNDGTVRNSVTGETLYAPGDEPIEIVPGVKIDLNTNQITYDELAVELLVDPEESTESTTGSSKVNVNRR